MINLVHVPGIENTSDTFRDKVVSIADEIGTDPNLLMAVMSFESAGSFSPSIKNLAGSGAVGLIQFMPKTAKGLGTSTQALAKMTAEEQLEFVRLYFRDFKGKLKTVEDTYMAVLMPTAVGKGPKHVLFKKGSTAFRQNRGLDSDGDGVITVAEAAAVVRKRLGAPLSKFEKPLAPGDTGTKVGILQNELIDLGYLTLEEFKTGPGIFGPKTERGLKAFQTDIELDASGLLDSATQAVIAQLNAGVRKGNLGGIVGPMQKRLVAMRLMTAAEVATGPGILGPFSHRALTAFQRKTGLEASGILTDETYRALFRGDPVPTEAGIDAALRERGLGFTTYSREPGGADQFGTPSTIRALTDLAIDWNSMHPEVPLQFGDISRRGGGLFKPHKAHQKGREVDMRPIRRDNALAPTHISESSYDNKRTTEIVDLVRRSHPQARILFNDPKLTSAGKTTFVAGHSDHLHIGIP